MSDKISRPIATGIGRDGDVTVRAIAWPDGTFVLETDFLDAAWAEAMTDLEWTAPPPDPTALVREPRRCRRHAYEPAWLKNEPQSTAWDGHARVTRESQWPDDIPVMACFRHAVPKLRDEARVRRGKTARRRAGRPSPGRQVMTEQDYAAKVREAVEDELLRHVNLELTVERAKAILAVFDAVVLRAAPAPSEHDARVQLLEGALRDALRLAHPFALSPAQRERIIERAGRALAAPAPSEPGLDAAWAEAEAADPNFEVCELRKRGKRWVASAWATDGRVRGFLTHIDDDYDTPAAALRALTEKLRERPDSPPR